MKSREAFFQRVTASLIVPITFLPIAAVLLAIGDQLGVTPVQQAGIDLLRAWLPLIYGLGIAIGFTDGDAMAALSTVAGYVTMVSVAATVAQEPGLNVGVLGGVAAGGVCTVLYRRVKDVSLPEFLALFSGKRMGPIVATVAGVALGYLFGYVWPPIQDAILAVGNWVYAAGAGGAFLYGSLLRILVPTGLHHLLIQLVDMQLGVYTNPEGAVFYGEYLRFLAGDPEAGRILSGFFISVSIAPVGAAMAIAAEARPEQRRRVLGLMTTGALTSLVLGITEPIEFAFIFASPVLYVIHILLSGLASLLGWLLHIRGGGYALPLLLINWRHTENAWLILPLGIIYILLYFYLFRAVIRWLRPPILGQTADPTPGEGRPAGEEGTTFLEALGGPQNLQRVDACMTRLRVVVADRAKVDQERLRQLGASGVVFPGAGGDVQVVVGTRAGDISVKVQEALAAALAGGSFSNSAEPFGAARAPVSAEPMGHSKAPMGDQPALAEGLEVSLVSPFTGQTLPLSEVPDAVFAGSLVGRGCAVLPSSGLLHAPVSGEVAQIFPGGHALGISTAEGLEVLVHVGIDTVALQGEGFRLHVRQGDRVEAGQPIGECDLTIIAGAGKPLVTPVLVTNLGDGQQIEVLTEGPVKAGQPLYKVKARRGRRE